MLCTFHHHLVHEGGWTVTAAAESAFAFHSPAGALLAPEPPHELVDDSLDWLREWADEHKLDLGPEVNMPQWDGEPPDYDGAVGYLLAAGLPGTSTDPSRGLSVEAVHSRFPGRTSGPKSLARS